MRLRALATVVCLFAVGLAGCGRDPVQRVTGTVTLDGKPFVGATVTFAPREPKLPPNSAVTDDRGAFQLTRHPITRYVLKPGKYAVFVSKRVDKTGQPTADVDPDQLEKRGEITDLVDPLLTPEQRKAGVADVDIHAGDNEVPPIRFTAGKPKK
ncbi:MAG: carboxypeptidase-like regulatory domain-containing protein [Gemmataceae bacterium]